jgi:hypothetical protein
MLLVAVIVLCRLHLSIYGILTIHTPQVVKGGKAGGRFVNGRLLSWFREASNYGWLVSHQYYNGRFGAHPENAGKVETRANDDQQFACCF